MMNKINGEELVELNTSSMYWALQMIQAAWELVDEGQITVMEVAEDFGEDVANFLTERSKGITFTQAATMARGVADKVYAADGVDPEFFERYEDFAFQMGEISNTYDRMKKLCILLGFEEGVEAVLNDIGAELGSFAVL